MYIIYYSYMIFQTYFSIISKGGSLHLEKILLMMMRAFAPSAATDATTTSGLGRGSGSGSQSKNSRSYLKLILCCFLLNSCPHTKFHPTRTKNIEVSFSVNVNISLISSQNGPTSPTFLKQKLKTSFLQYESKIEDSLRFFPE